MKRREFITLVGGAAAWPVAARAQPLPVIGIMRSTSPDEAAVFLGPFSEGLQSEGYADGRNVAVDLRTAGNVYERLPEIAADLVRKRVAVIVATGALNTALAAKAATTTIPIVFIIGSDPVERGLVKSLNRPEGNITGATLFGGPLNAKRVELLRELVPNAKAIGLLVRSGNVNSEPEIKELHGLAGDIGFVLHAAPVSKESELDPAFAAMAEKKVSGLLYSTDIFFSSRNALLSKLAETYRLPVVHRRRVADGLISYGTRPADTYRVGGTYTGRILKGAKPSDLPVQLPTTFELVVNLKAAKAIGVTVPTSILLRADEVIE